MTTLADHDPSEEPLIALSCNHLFTISTLDGVVNIESVYQKNKKGEWAGVCELPAKCGAIPQCPHCRSPITNVRRYLRNEDKTKKLLIWNRYGRILSHRMIEQASIKFRLKTEDEARTGLIALNGIAETVAKYEESNADINGKEFRDIKQRISEIARIAGNLQKTVTNEQPERRVYEKAVVALANQELSIHIFIYSEEKNP
jgi:hypothetical protein